MLVEEDARQLEMLPGDRPDPELLREPCLHRAQEHPPRARKAVHLREEEPLELQQRLFVEDGVIESFWRDPSFLQTICDRVHREAAVVLAPREALLLRRGDDLAIADQTRGGVVVETRDPKDVHGVALELARQRNETVRRCRAWQPMAARAAERVWQK